ncbi:protein-disulfide reductase DsbD family protein [Arachidicoccus terrestris]|uniref:protein-disulfide reductase DsbD family protein n=1 Tax=Arachidicoccus terrestris TaxID=2875539 RepID=UPI001CC6B6F9|nr:cytochrome c biogenesis protein CcdA [Arachidicoccus terrestris]UAY56487.1 thioredoxin family protein [Arachidicoccus terrestris]
MRKFILLLSFFIAAIIGCKAQPTDSRDDTAVHFTADIQRISDTIAVLSIKATIASGNMLMSTRKFSEEDAFISTLELDSSLKAYQLPADTVTEKGKIQSLDAPDLGGTLHYYTDSVSFELPLHIKSSEEATVRGAFTWLAKNGDNFPSGEYKFVVPLKKGSAAQAVSKGNASSIAGPANDIDTNNSLLKIFWLGLIAGLIAVFTPCVFPLIPVTVSFFLKRSQSKREGIRNAVIYSISIILIYTVPTFVLTKIFGDDIMYTIATSAIANLLFFVIFIIFAISFFGGFELTLPSSWATKADQKASGGGLIGIFFMALTLVIVSFSCTGPFVGSLLAQVSSANSAHAGSAAVFGMLGLSAGLAIPFSLFAFFPSLLHVLPKSGGWLNSVKVVFGFIELALAMKFLSMVDQIYGWHLLDREIFLAIWIVLTLLAGFYLLGKLKFSHDSDLKFISIPRLFFAIIFLTFGVYLIPGMWGAPLKSMSGLLPPVTTQDFDLNALQYKLDGIASSSGGGSNTADFAAKADPPKLYIDKLHVPYGLTAYYDLDEGLKAAKALNKPVMLDFTGHSCTNCRKMEQEVWGDPEVLKRIKNDFVLVSLYVDENSTLPVEQQYTAKNGKYISTVGDKNKDYEISTFGVLVQPLYMFLDVNGQPLSMEHYGYDSDIDKFVKHLDDMKAAFEARKQ